MLRVLKFGGTSLGSEERVHNVAKITSGDFNKGDQIVVVVSAVGGITDKLIDCAKTAEYDGKLALEKIKDIQKRHQEVFPKELADPKIIEQINKSFAELQELVDGISLVHECSIRTMDLVSSFGERLSAQLMTALVNMQYTGNAEYIDARTVVKTDRNHGEARVLFEQSYANIQNAINESKIYFVTGFIASTEDGITTTLGRGGSDYSAALFGAALEAEQVEIWTDVDGFMSADPRLVNEAFVLPKVSYEEAMELSYFGAKVIHPQTLVPAIKKNIPVLIKNSFAPQKPGTVISNEKTDLEHPVKGIASFKGISLINIEGSGMVGVPGVASRVFGALAKQRINVIMITQASSEHSICFAVKTSDSESAKQALENEFESEIFAGKIDPINRTNGLSIIAAVGENMAGIPGITGKLFDALGRNSVNIVAIAQGSSERNVSLVINESDVEKAVNVIHAAFYLSHRASNLFIIGTGNIGGTLLQQIHDAQKDLLKSHDLLINVCAIADVEKMIVDENGINLSNWQEQLEQSETTSNIDVLVNTIKESQLINSIIVDVTASDAIASKYEEFLKAGIHIVTPNKRANTKSQDYYDALRALTKEHRLHYYYETTVGAGLPLINTIKGLKGSGDNVQKINGVFSGSLNYIFSSFNAGNTFSGVVKEAFEKGYTEPDPRDDLSGMDVARKLLILSRENGLKLELDKVQVEAPLSANLMEGSLDDFWKNLSSADAELEKRRQAAADKGCVLRFVGTMENGDCTVAIAEIPNSHPMALSTGTNNFVEITTDRYLELPLIIQGPGAGREVTAGGIFADIISLSLHLS